MSHLLRILLVEDNPGDADLLMFLLPQDGSTPLDFKCVTRLSEALEAVAEARFDLILLDLGLPDSNGLETLRIMRRHTVLLPIIVLTGNSDEGLGVDAIRVGAQDYLIKGETDGNLLSRSLKYAVERKKSENALKELNDTLEERILERTAQITAVNETLQSEIAERTRVEESERRTKEEWERTFASVPDLIAILDNRHRVLRINDAMARRLGFKPEECIGLPCYEVIHGTSSPPDFCPHSRTISDGCEHVEELHVDLFEGDFLVTTTPLLGAKGERLGSVHIARDVTERKQMVDELRQSEERYRLLFDTMTEGFSLNEIILDEVGKPVDLRYISVNPAFERYTGLKAKDVVGRTTRGLFPDAEPVWFERYGKVALTGEPVHFEERFGPLEKWFEVSAYRTEPGRFAVIFFDISGRKADEEALKKLNDELEIRVAERTRELREKDQMLLLQSRQAAMGEMIGNIAHQWRQPLNALGLTIQQMEMFYDLGEFTKEYLEKSIANSMNLIRHMSQTIDDFRNYFRPDKEKVEFKVTETIRKTLALLEDSLKERQIKIEVAINNAPVIYGYPNEFAQVLLNILVNAKDALAERAIEDPRVMIAVGNEGGRAVLTVSDNAGGIPVELMEKVFDPYFTTKGCQQGTGVGLFMSKTIIEKNMGGHLTVRNVADGAEFRIEL